MPFDAVWHGIYSTLHFLRSRCVCSRAAVTACLVFSYFSYVTSMCCWSIGCVCAWEENKIRAHFQCCVICFCFGWCHDSQWHYFWCMIMTWCMHINLYYYIEAFHILSSLKQNTNSKTLYALHIIINGIKANCDACCFVMIILFFLCLVFVYLLFNCVSHFFLFSHIFPSYCDFHFEHLFC